MKNFGKILTVASMAAAMASCGGSAINTNIALKNETDSASYAFGALMGTQASNTFSGAKEELDFDLNKDPFIAGFISALNKDTNNLKFKSPQEAQMYFAGVVNKYEIKKNAEQQKEAEANLAKGQAFLDENAKKEGVMSLPSGCQYQVITEGTGKQPTIDDMVECHYVGTLIDGTQFDSSVDRGEPATFPLRGVIQGWQELIPMMKVGSKWRLFIPSELAYGPQGRPGIPGNSVLIFEVELLQIVKE